MKFTRLFELGVWMNWAVRDLGEPEWPLIIRYPDWVHDALSSVAAEVQPIDRWSQPSIIIKVEIEKTEKT
jgi:hypothetical protein